LFVVNDGTKVYLSSTKYKLGKITGL